MKKVLSVVLAVAMVLACVASLAFVVGVNPGIDTPTNNALKVEDFYVTDELAMTTGVKLYAQIADLENQLYAKNQNVRFAVDLAVYNPTYAANGVKNTAATGDSATLIFESDTVDFGLNATNAGTMVLYKPMYIGANIVTTSYANAVANKKYTPELSQDHHSMDVDVTYFTNNNGAFLTLQDAAKSTFNKDNGVVLYGVSGDPTVVKTDFTLVITGLTTGELDQEGRVTVSMQDKAGDTFSDDIGGRGVVTVEKNGRTYKILKWYDANKEGVGVTNHTARTMSYYATRASGDLQDSYEHTDVGYIIPGTYDLLWAEEDKASITSYNSQMYDADVVGYRVFRHLSNGADGRADTADDIWGLIGMFETEQIPTGSGYDSVEARGQDSEGGRSLGMDYWDGKKWHRVYGNSLDAYGQIVYYTENNQPIFKTSGTIDYLRGFKFAENGSYENTGAEQTGYVSARTALNDFLSDFGMGTGSQYSYKIQDSNFTEAATYDELGTATYNGNAIVVPQPDEDPDVEEPTDNDEVPDEGDIDEEPIPDEGDIDEDPIPDEPVPETGDASAAVAVALTAAALVAAAGLAVVLKKAR